ncbi:MAG: DUF4097 family beta strand repeat protein [Spirochaetaceae bacterium]|jgi:DUF4097 and DUF4098 domain-containing protein YvlB|nr:DUF4097 family beta strand repeat protein [Spirochaetaceae bacterium]MDN5333847.1 lia operon protein LiaG [Sphaerochaeta sp.]
MLKDTNANKIFLIILVLILALSFFLYKGWERRGIEQRMDQQIDFQAGDSLQVSTISNDIFIEVNEGQKQASVSLGSHDNEQLEVSKRGSLVTVSVSPVKRWFLRFFSYTASPLVLTLPSENLGHLEVTSTSGDITLMRPLKTKSTKVSGVSSEVDFLTLWASEHLELHTISGDISGKEASSDGNADISSTSGTIEIQRITGPKTILKTTSSGIEAGVSISKNGSMEAKTTSGEIELDLRPSNNLNITTSTVSGSIEFNDKRQAGNNASLQTGEGSNSVTLSSVSGSIDLVY